MLFSCARRFRPVTKLGHGPLSSWSSMGVGWNALVDFFSFGT